jgi:hypothetical protein
MQLFAEIYVVTRREIIRFAFVQLMRQFRFLLRRRLSQNEAPAAVLGSSSSASIVLTLSVTGAFEGPSAVRREVRAVANR